MVAILYNRIPPDVASERRKTKQG